MRFIEKYKKLCFFLGRPCSPLYAMIMHIRAFAYRKGLLSTVKLPVPVISVGNLTMGGTGKTPMVCSLADMLKSEGYRVAVISRGYGGRAKDNCNVVADGTEVLLSAEMAGDEPRMLAESLPGVMVLTGRKRHCPASKSVAMGAEVLLLDDGFQHLGVDRDLDMVLFSADELAGNSIVFPGGDLREPISALGRATCFVLTGVNQTNQDRAQRFGQLLAEKFPGKPVYMSRLEVDGFCKAEDDKVIPVSRLQSSADYLVICGIARPDSFKTTLASCGIDYLEFVAFADHHSYNEQDYNLIENKLSTCGAKGIVCTEKDMVKLAAYNFSVPVYGLKVRAVVADELRNMILDSLEAVLKN